MRECKKREVIISGYGPGNNQQASVAIYTIMDKMESEKEIWSSTVVAPSYLCTYKDMCFAIREEEKSGSVLLYKRMDDKYLLQDELLLEGGALCHIAYQPVNQTLYCSFYETGHVAAVKVANYHFQKILNFFQIKAEDKECLTRVHCCTLEPDGTRVFVSNIALDRIYVYESRDGMLSPSRKCEFIQLEKGIGPRHLKFHPIHKYLYLITEYSSEILTFLYKVEGDVPHLELLQRISTLPKDFTGNSTGSTIDISKDGRFLYAANRGADTIAVFEINPQGLLHKIQDTGCLGKCPRHIALTKDDTGLLIANQDSDQVVLVQVDENSGRLSEVVLKIPFYKPSYVEEI